MSPFAVAKALESVVGKNYSAKKLSSGDIQVQVENRKQSSALYSLTHIGETAVTVSSHRTLNIVRGVISESELLECSDSELEEGLADEGVVLAKRIVMRRDGKEVPTKHVVLSFKLHSLPSTIKAGYLNCHVRAYIPNPRRCYKCQKFGHGSQVCRGQAVCARCAGKDHSSETCSNDIRCTNCEGNHPAYSRSCPFWQEEKQVLKIKFEQNVTYRAARAQLQFQKKGTFSDVVRRGVAPLRVSVETQTSGPPHHTPQLKERVTEVLPPVATQPITQGEAATASKEVVVSPSVWDGIAKGLSQSTSQDMDVDDDDCLSQKSSSSLPSTTTSSLGKEQRKKNTGRGRGLKGKEQQKAPPPRIQAP
ncbi:uncharacterized protein LOC135395237 [Ornithodoros turicata]|uniref:uncharacterized protein LOC135395237 n=1 Tax=Ornithodoros turicata TaxID=34597 RepID=UPI003138CCDA